MQHSYRYWYALFYSSPRVMSVACSSIRITVSSALSARQDKISCHPGTTGTAAEVASKDQLGDFCFLSQLKSSTWSNWFSTKLTCCHSIRKRSIIHSGELPGASLTIATRVDSRAARIQSLCSPQ